MKNYTLKLGNMRKEKSFTLYPYSGGDFIMLQSEKRFAKINLITGKGIMNKKASGYSGFHSISGFLPLVDVSLPDNIKIEIQKFLWHNEGADGNISGVVSYENKKLFSITG